MIYLYTLRDSAQQVEGITGVLAICFLIWILIKQEGSFCILKKKKRHGKPRDSQMALGVKNPPTNARDTGDGFNPCAGNILRRKAPQPTLVVLPGASHGPWTEDPGRLQSMRPQRVGHNYYFVTLVTLHACISNLNNTFMLKTSCALFLNVYTRDKFALNNV